MKVILESNSFDVSIFDRDTDIDDGILPPIQLPLYDVYVLNSNCALIQGLIESYTIDSDNGEICLFLDLTSSPLDYFSDADFEIDGL